MAKLRRPHRITKKQKAFVQKYLETGNGTKSVMAVYDYDDRKVAGVKAHKNLNSRGVQLYMKKVMDDVGMSDDYIAGGLKKISDAGMTKRALKKAKPQDSLRALEMSARVKDLFPAEKKKIQKSTFKLNLEGKSTDELMQILDGLRRDALTFKKIVKQSEDMKELKTSKAKEEEPEEYIETVEQAPVEV